MESHVVSSGVTVPLTEAEMMTVLDITVTSSTQKYSEFIFTGNLTETFNKADLSTVSFSELVCDSLFESLDGAILAAFTAASAGKFCTVYPIKYAYVLMFGLLYL